MLFVAEIPVYWAGFEQGSSSAQKKLYNRLNQSKSPGAAEQAQMLGSATEIKCNDSDGNGKSGLPGKFILLIQGQ